MENSILIVDDQETNRKAYRITIEDSGLFQYIDIAGSEAEARGMILKNNYDVILTDMIMNEDDDGIKVLNIAKEKDPWCMVLVITANDKKLQRYKAFDKGAFDCISKSAPGIKSSDEIIAKCKTALNFRNMALNQIEKEKNLDKLKRYFDPNVFESIRSNPDILIPTNKIVSIVFWDIRGFSKLSETLKAHPDLIAGFLKEYCELAAKCIFEEKGVLDKFIGDGVMALFGALETESNMDIEHATNAANAAIKLREEFNSIHKKWMDKWSLYSPEKIDIGLGCGIHTGQAIVGNINTEIRDDFTALGPTVNLAARVEGRSAKSQILISSTTEVRIKQNFSTNKVGVIDDIKNIPGEYAVYELSKK